jgi:hypothetical protein
MDKSCLKLLYFMLFHHKSWNYPNRDLCYIAKPVICPGRADDNSIMSIRMRTGRELD